MNHRTKRTTIFLLVGTLVALILLSASLSNLDLHAGTPFPGSINSGKDIPVPANDTMTGTYTLTLLRGIFALIFLFLMIFISARLLVLVDVKRIYKLTLFMIPLLLLIIILSQIEPGQPAHLPSEESIGITTPPSFDYPVSPLGPPPQGLIRLVLIAFVFGAVLLAVKIFRLRLYPTNIKEQLLQEAETALDAIKMGEHLRNVIIRCYFQMTRVLEEERRIERSDSMTAREFEDWLEFNGFPTAPVHQLTRLFEKVRYGAQLTMKDDEETAIESLKAIIQFCRSERE